MKKWRLFPLLTALLLNLAGCANLRDPASDEDRIHGSAGVRFQSQDTSHFAADRVPY